MGEILKSLLVPHPPIMVPEVGGKEVEKVKNTVEALRQLEGELKLLNPDTLIIITSHGAVFRDGLAVTTVPKLYGDLSQFNAPEVSLNFKNNLELAEKIIGKASNAGITTLSMDEKTAGEYGVTTKLDHGIMAPIYYLARHLPEMKLLPISMGMLSYLELYRFGMVVAEAVRESGSRAVFAASGDMSHRLHHDAPAGFNPRGKEFDDAIVEGIKEFNVSRLLNLPSDLVEAAGECGLRPLNILLGTLDGFKVETKVLSYEGPFGVGYLVADFKPGIFSDNYKRYEKLLEEKNKHLDAEKLKETIPVRLARKTLESFVKEGKIPEFEDYAAELRIKAGAFVSLKKEGQLRGCIGTTEPTKQDLGHEIMQNAISAGTRDPRFNPVTEDELPYLKYSVDVLKPAERINSMEELEPKRYGVIVRSGGKSGLLLPDLEGVDTVEEQVAIAKQKAGIHEGEPFEIERFEVERFY